MSTRSRIALKNPDGTCVSVYVHCDGYPAGVGRTLLDHYGNRRRVEQILNLGDMNALGPTPCDPGKAWEDTFIGFRDGESFLDRL